MPNWRVTHVSYGPGVLTDIEGGKAVIKFSNGVIKFKVAGLDKFITFDDVELKQLIQKETKSAMTQPAVQVGSQGSKATINTKQDKYTAYAPTRANAANNLLGPRAGNVHVSSEAEMYELIGYLARPGRISSIEAEVPADDREETFKKLFPGQAYRPIHLSYTPSGMVNKMNCQFRINLMDITNCPLALRNNIGAGNSSSSCVARINKSQFVMNLVVNYGFRFGSYQDYQKIQKLAEQRGYLAVFKKGLTR